VPILEYPYVHLLPDSFFGGALTKINDGLYKFHDETWGVDSRHLLGFSREAIHSLEKISDPTKLPIWLFGHALNLKPDGSYNLSGSDEIFSKDKVLEYSTEVQDKVQGADLKGDQWGAKSHDEWYAMLEDRIAKDPLTVMARQVMPDPLEFTTFINNWKNTVYHAGYPSDAVAVSGIGQTHANALLNADFENSAFTGAATEYLALFTVAPSDTGVGTEATYTNYLRLTITMSAGNWPAASAGTITYGVVATFAQSGGTTNVITDAALMAASSGGTQPLYWGDLTGGSQSIATGNTPQFNANSIVCSMA